MCFTESSNCLWEEKAGELVALMRTANESVKRGFESELATNTSSVATNTSSVVHCPDWIRLLRSSNGANINRP